MPVSNRYLLEQWPTVVAMGRAALRGAVTRRERALSKDEASLRELYVERPPLPPALVADYIRHVGGDPAAWAGDLPTHLFPQWVFPLQLRLLEGLGVPLARALNAGARLESERPLPADETLLVRAWLDTVDDRDGRVTLRVASSTGTASAPNALRAEMTLLMRRSHKKSGAARVEAQVPADAQELGRLHIPARAGMDFARLTGDLNPVHWLSPYARALGFRHVINHGFSSMARTMEVLIRERHASDPRALGAFQCRFTRPLLLPADVGVFMRGQDVSLGAGPNQPTYLEAHETPKGVRGAEVIHD